MSMCKLTSQRNYRSLVLIATHLIISVSNVNECCGYTDKFFDVGVHNQFSNTQIIVGDPYPNWGSDAIRWNINGTCINPTLALSTLDCKCYGDICLGSDFSTCFSTFSEIDDYDLIHLVNETTVTNHLLVQTTPIGCNPACLSANPWYDGVYFVTKLIIHCEEPQNFTSTDEAFNCDDSSSGGEEMIVVLKINTDVFYEQLSWNMRNQADNYNTTIMNVSAIEYGGKELISQRVCIEPGCYTFDLYDSADNGMIHAGWYYSGWFELLVNNKSVTMGKQSFDSSHNSLYFCIANATKFPAIGSNYNIHDNLYNLTIYISNNKSTYVADFEIKITELENRHDLSIENVIYRNQYQASLSSSNHLAFKTLVNNYSCYNIELTNINNDINDNSIKVLLNNQKLSLEQQTLTFQESTESTLYWCLHDILEGINNLTITVDFSAQWIITDVGLSGNDDFVIYKNELGLNGNSDTRTIWNAWVDDGCIKIVFYDFDDAQIVTTDGFYYVWINDKIVSFGEYRQTIETIIVCTDDNHMSYCITPEYCRNNNDIFITGVSLFDDTYLSGSYHGLSNCTLDNESLALECLGMKSCLNMYGLTNSVSVYGAFGLNESQTLTEYTYVCDNGSVSNFAFYNAEQFLYAAKTVTCYGLYSCQNSQSHTTIGYSSSSLMNVYTRDLVTNGSLIALDTVITLLSVIDIELCMGGYCWQNYDETTGGVVKINILDGYFLLFNTTLKCSHQTSSVCNIYCSTNNSQYFILDSSCSICDIHDCNLIENISQIDNHSLNIISEISQLVTNIRDTYIYDCDNDGSVTYDISHAAAVSSFGSSYSISVFNDIYGEVLCCRGYQSCFQTQSIYTVLGNILCLGYESCAQTGLVWTGDDSDSSTQASIFCASESACAGSLLQADSVIACTSQNSCEDAVIWQASKLYCTMNACKKARIRKVEITYFIDSQTNAIIYSGYIGETFIYFRGIGAGNDITYHCDVGDTCYFDCGENSCDSTTTKLYCSGKCFVQCFESNNTKDCVNIITSLAPTITPTAAPSNAPIAAPSSAPSFTPTTAPTQTPTVGPSNSPSTVPSYVPTESPIGTPTEAPTTAPTLNPSASPSWSPTESGLLTEEELASYFNWFIGSLIIISIIVLIIGLIDAKKGRKNELFEWKPIYMFSIYTNDFFSGIQICSVCV